MTDTNSTTLRNALAAAVKKHADDNGLSAKKGAELADVQLSRFYQVMRGEVSKISSDALVNMLGNFGYRLTATNGSGNSTEIVLSLDKSEGQVLPEIEKPVLVVKSDEPEIGYSADEPFVEIHPEDPEYADPDAGRLVSDDE